MIGPLVHERLSATPERVALRDEARAWTAGELDAAARAWAHVLRSRRRVGLLADNGLELAGALLGALYAGAAVVPFHAGTPDEELADRVARFSVDVLVTDRAPAAGVPLIALAPNAAPPPPPPAARLVRPPRPLSPGAGEPALLLGTSGTTGEPRAVIVTQHGLAAHAAAFCRVLGLGPGDRVLATLPLAHSYGVRTALLVPLMSGAEIVLARHFSARRTLALIASAGITWVPAVPTMLSAWAAVPGAPCPSLRWVLSAGAPLAEAVRLRAERRLGCPVREGYGLTEASFSTVDAPPAPPAPGTVGRPLPGVELRLDPLTSEVQLRGVNVMGGYLDDAAGTRAAFTDDGWLRTGDVGALDSGGNLRIVDRIKDIILSGGHTIYPAEVEAVLARHPAIRAVAVVGRPDPHLGEVIVAHVVLAGDAPEAAAADLTEWSKAHLAAYKVPRVVVRHPELPLGPSGKVLKRSLR